MALRSMHDDLHFRELFDNYTSRVHDYIRAISHSDYIAEEVTQELFLILWRKRNDLDKVEHIDQYIFRIARNLAVRLIQKAAMDQKLAAAFFKASKNQQNDVTDKETERTVQTLIDQAVLALPPQPRKIYLLSRKEHLNFDEMAKVTGLSRNTVKNHLQKALNDIRNYLVTHGYQPVIAAILVKVLG